MNEELARKDRKGTKAISDATTEPTETTSKRKRGRPPKRRPEEAESSDDDYRYKDVDEIDPGQLELVTQKILDDLDKEDEDSEGEAQERSRTPPKESKPDDPRSLREHWEKTRNTGEGTDPLADPGRRQTTSRI